MTQRPPLRQAHANTRQSPSRQRPARKASAAGITRREMLSAASGAVVAAGVGAVAWKVGFGPSGSPQQSALASPEPTASPTPRVATPPRIAVQASPEPEPTQTPVPGSPASDMVEETSIAEINRGLEEGWFSIEEYIQASLDRIDAMDQQGPGLNAVIELNPDALAIARELDEEARQGRRRGPMHGIPVLVKDVFATHDAMRTTAGSLALADNQTMRDAFMIEALREAGAVILGKTNMTEFSNFRGGTPSGWSSRGGFTVNPYITSFSAWGSSTGSAVSVAASYVPLSIGAETDGSILCPASACGIVGLKPTVGLVSRRGSLGISFIQDSPGPMGRTVEDVAYGLSAIAGYDAGDMAFDAHFGQHSPAARFDQIPVPNIGERDYTRVLDPDGLRGARIGVCRSMFGFDPTVDAHVENALDAMREAGAEIIDDIWMDAVGVVAGSGTEGNMLVMEFGRTFQQFLDGYLSDGPIRSLADVVEFNYAHPDQTLMHGGQEGLEIALQAAPVEDWWFGELVTGNITATRDNGIDLTMDQYDLDALVAPTAGLPTSLALDAMRGASSQVPSMAGYPSLTLPVGYSYGIPAGIHFFGRAFSEQTLLKLAYGLEQNLQARRPPEYLTTPPADYDLESTPGDYVPEYPFPEEPWEEYPEGEWSEPTEWDATGDWSEEPAADEWGG